MSTKPSAAPMVPRFECSPARAWAEQGHGYDGAFRDVLQGYASGEREGGSGGDDGFSGERPGKHHADGHALRQVVQRDGQHQHGRAGKRAFQPLRLIAAGMQVREQTVQRQQKHGAQHKAARRGKPGGRAGLFGHFHSGNQQRPH